MICLGKALRILECSRLKPWSEQFPMMVYLLLKVVHMCMKYNYLTLSLELLQTVSRKCLSYKN